MRKAVLAYQGKDWKKSADAKFQSRVRKYGDWPPLMAGCLVVVGLARLMNRRRLARVVVAAMLASTLAGLIANASRLTTGRTRPKESPKIEAGWYGPWHDGKLLIGRPAYNSFPSGHTATAFGLAAVVVFASPAVGVLAVVGAGLVAWASIATGNHHPSDVTVSVILAFFVGGLVWRWMRGSGGDWVERWLRFPPRAAE